MSGTPEPPEELERTLNSRQIRMIAIGFGVGLFLGWAKAIHFAGPGLILVAYAIHERRSRPAG